jgi:L-amino acid N-acyltransferase YncA
MIDMRPATMADTDLLLSWRNDPVTCANSKSTATVSREDHERWMKFNVAQGYPQHMVMIANSQVSGSIGVVRFDAERSDVMKYEVSITIAPEHRGCGLGRPVLATACAHMPDVSLSAMIRKENTASRRIFEECGFEETDGEHGFVTCRREPLS